MTSNAKLAAVGIVVAGAVIITLILSISIVSQNTNEKLAEAIKSGADPVRVGCAFNTITALAVQQTACLRKDSAQK